MNITQCRTDLILRVLQESHYAEWCERYGEPGYSDPERGIIFCNWNPIPKRIYAYLEEAGYSLEWSDEWTIDYANNKAYRHSPDSYGWIQQFVYTEDGELLTPDDSIDEWLEEFQMTDKAHPHRALPDWITEEDLTERGYSKIGDDYESGFHPGQTDDPRKIAERAFESGARSVVFRVKENSQFYVVFQGYSKSE